MTRKREPRRKAAGSRYPVLTLTDEQWSEVVRLSAIPPLVASKAQRELQTHLGIHRQLIQRRMRLNGAFKELAVIRRAFQRLAKLLPTDDFSKDLRNLQQIESRYFIKGAGPSKTGPKSDADYDLIAYLCGFAERLGGKTIHRSNKKNDISKEFIRYVCKIADPGISSGTIDKAMRSYISYRRLTGGLTTEEAMLKATGILD